MCTSRNASIRLKLICGLNSVMAALITFRSSYTPSLRTSWPSFVRWVKTSYSARHFASRSSVSGFVTSSGGTYGFSIRSRTRRGLASFFFAMSIQRATCHPEGSGSDGHSRSGYSRDLGVEVRSRARDSSGRYRSLRNDMARDTLAKAKRVTRGGATGLAGASPTHRKKSAARVGWALHWSGIPLHTARKETRHAPDHPPRRRLCPRFRISRPPAPPVPRAIAGDAAGRPREAESGGRPVEAADPRRQRYAQHVLRDRRPEEEADRRLRRRRVYRVGARAGVPQPRRQEVRARPDARHLAERPRQESAAPRRIHPGAPPGDEDRRPRRRQRGQARSQGHRRLLAPQPRLGRQGQAERIDLPDDGERQSRRE